MRHGKLSWLFHLAAWSLCLTCLWELSHRTWPQVSATGHPQGGAWHREPSATSADRRYSWPRTNLPCATTGGNRFPGSKPSSVSPVLGETASLEWEEIAYKCHGWKIDKQQRKITCGNLKDFSIVSSSCLTSKSNSLGHSHRIPILCCKNETSWWPQSIESPFINYSTRKLCLSILSHFGCITIQPSHHPSAPVLHPPTQPNQVASRFSVETTCEAMAMDSNVAPTIPPTITSSG